MENFFQSEEKKQSLLNIEAASANKVLLTLWI